MAMGSNSTRPIRAATWLAAGIAGVLVVLLGALVAGGLVLALVARGAAVRLDAAIGFSRRTPLPDDLPSLAAPDVPE
jgi:hypothetical protein